MVHAETISPDTNSGIATFGTYLKANNSIQGSAAAIPVETVKRAIRPRWASKKAQVIMNIDMGINVKNATETA
jgi:hypothetical protein